MKMRLFLALGLCCVVLVDGDTFAPGRAIVPRRSGRTVQTLAEKCTSAANVGKRYCGSDVAPYCDAVQLYHCSGVGSGLTFGCSGALPYCIESTPGQAYCSSTQAEGCEPAQPDFECTGSGVFPDPLNCKKYYYCSEESGALVSQAFECERLYAFDPSGPNGEYCRLINNDNSFCTQITCDGTVRNTLLSYRTFPSRLGQIVASCRADGKSPYVFRCESGFQANLGTLPVQCDLVCTRADKREYPDDETMYYECIYNGSRWESRLKSCFRGYVFNSSLKRCVLAPTTITAATTTV